MNFLKVVGLVLLLVSLPAMASANPMGIHDVNHVWFDQPTRIGALVLPAGNYTIRHSMEGEDHVMAFQNATSKAVFKVKCRLVPLGQKASQDQSIFELKSGSERVLHELVFRGDTAKHVF
jgi:urease accessory protein UreF